MTAFYLAQAKQRLDAIQKLAAGHPREHVYQDTPFGKKCVGCGKLRGELLSRVCEGSLYDGDPQRALKMKLAALAILQLEVAELIRRLGVADEALEWAKTLAEDAAQVDVIIRAISEIRKPAE